MKVLQFRHEDGRHLGVVDGDGSVVDIAGPLSRRGVPPTFTGALAAARRDGSSMAELVAHWRRSRTSDVCT